MVTSFRDFAIFCGLPNPNETTDQVTRVVKGLKAKEDGWEGPFPTILSSLIAPLRTLTDNGVPKLALSSLFIDVFTMVARN